MTGKQRGRAGRDTPALPGADPPPVSTGSGEAPEAKEKDMNTMHTAGLSQPQTSFEGVTVIGEAVRRLPPESAEFLIEVTAGAPTAAQALRESQNRIGQLVQAVAPLGIGQNDLQTISLHVHNLYSPLAAPVLPGAYGGMAQIGQPGFSPFAPGIPAQTEVQFGSYHARNTLRVTVRDAGRVGEIADTVARTGATILGGFSFRASDESVARRSALEAAGKDARAKADSLAVAAGKQVGEAVAITEDIVASNGALAALRSVAPLVLGAGAPQVAGELEYYARVTANFRFQ
jgi:uncharacterized protein YggE